MTAKDNYYKEKMSRLRRERKEHNKCTRCGKPLENGICQPCRDYAAKYNFSKKLTREPKPRKLKSWDVTNSKLDHAMNNSNIKTKDLAFALNVSPRTVQRWRYEGSEPIKSRQRDINDYLGQEIYELD